MATTCPTKSNVRAPRAWTQMETVSRTSRTLTMTMTESPPPGRPMLTPMAMVSPTISIQILTATASRIPLKLPDSLFLMLTAMESMTTSTQTIRMGH